MNITRRQVIVLSLSFLGLASSRWSLGALLNAYRDDWIALLANGLDREAVGQLAGAYLELHPEEKADPDFMIGLILNEYDDTEGVGVYLRNNVRKDFTQNDAVNLSGWRLSRTEGRILTLLSTMLTSIA